MSGHADHARSQVAAAPSGRIETGLLVQHPATGGSEQANVSRAVASGRLSGNGPFTVQCERFLQNELGAERVLLTTSCTHALEMAALLLDIGPGDEVLLPSFTFVSCANAFVLRGARPVFVDVRPDTLNLDHTQIEGMLGPRTKAILAVHYAGIGCEMDDIAAVAAAHGVPVVEDVAHALFGGYRGRPLGTFGQLATLSFHETKNFTCGEGGALIINEPELVARAEILREKGTNRASFIRGEVDKYSWVDVGSSYVLSDVLAAFLYGQLERRGEIQRYRRLLWQRYMDALGPWADATGVRLPHVPSTAEPAYHLFYLLLPSLRERDRLMQHMFARGIETSFHYVPLHLAPMGQRFGYRAGELPVTEKLADRLLRIPFHNAMESHHQDAVCAALLDYSPEPSGGRAHRSTAGT